MERLRMWWKRFFSAKEEPSVKEETEFPPDLPATDEVLEEKPSALDDAVSSETLPLSEDALEQEVAEEEGKALASGTFWAGWCSDVGKVRQHNEDGLFIFMAEQESDHPLMPFGLFILADGMGGHQAGEIASAVATRVVAGSLLQQAYLPVLLGRDRSAGQPSLMEMMRQAVAAADREVSAEAPGSGTTLTAAMIIGERLIIGHVGDSRAYLRRVSEDGAVTLLTNDHSLVHKLVEIGQLTPEEAAVHPQRNMLYRAVGQGDALEVDVVSYALQDGDQLLLCSDGLWGEVREEEMWRIVAQAKTPALACQRLVEAANAAGGSDNITVILVEFHT